MQRPSRPARIPATARRTPVAPGGRPAPSGRDGARALLGAWVGAACGLLVYWSGGILFRAAELRAMGPAEAATHLLDPVRAFTVWLGVTVALGAWIGAAVARSKWHISGLLSYVGLLCLIGGYLLYTWTVAIPKVPADERWLSYILLGAEAGGLFLIVVFSFYSLDAATRRRWERSPQNRPYDPAHRPVVAFQVPVYNESVEMVEQTILHLVAQDYPRDRFHVVVCDDSTVPATRERLKRFCQDVGAVYSERPTRGGYKAGALNFATRNLPPDVELVAVIDADYWVRPDYLRSIVGHFVDPTLAFVQSPQDYRNGDESFLTRQYKRAEAYFYHAIMPSRNEQNAIIFCGTMGILRRSALQDVGGFAEDQVCEDADISVRLACRGWHSLYVDRSFGHGLMPAVFDAYKKQFHRWAFGNVKIFFARLGMILRSRMGARRKVDFLVSNLHWFDGFFVTAIAAALLYLGLGPILGYDAVSHHQEEIAFLALVPVFLLVDSIVRLHLVLARGSPVTFRDTLRVQGMWFAIKFTNMMAVTKAMVGVRTPFVRTPKDTGGRLGFWRSLGRSVWICRFETLVGLTLLAVAIADTLPQYRLAPGHGAYFLPAWLALYAVFFLCAPYYAHKSYRTLVPQRYATMTLFAAQPHRDTLPATAAPAPPQVASASGTLQTLEAPPPADESTGAPQEAPLPPPEPGVAPPAPSVPPATPG